MKCPLHPTIVDAASLFDLSELIEEQVGSKVTIDYRKFRERLKALRQNEGWGSDSPNTITILLSIDPSSEGQQRVQVMLRSSGFDLDCVDFRETFVSLPPGRNPNEFYAAATRDKPVKTVKSLASRIAYIAGLMARFDDPRLLVVSHSFDLYGPLTDLSRRVSKGKGKVGVAYFGSLLDYRWKLHGLFDQEIRKRLGLEFFDLDPYSDELLGVDLAGRARAASDGGS